MGENDLVGNFCVPLAPSNFLKWRHFVQINKMATTKLVMELLALADPAS